MPKFWWRTPSKRVGRVEDLVEASLMLKERCSSWEN